MKLEEYQQRAVTFLTQHPRAVLSMDMGLGKTAVIIEALNRLGVRRALVVAPKRVALTVWKEEANKWNDPHEWTVIKGTPSQRAVLWSRKTARTVCSYEQLAEALTLDFEAVVFDELTRLKHVTSKRFLYALGIRSTIRWGLTGTLLPNGAIDLFGQLAALGIYTATPHTTRRGKIYIPEFFRWRATYFEDLNAFSGLPFHRWRILPPHTLKSILESVKGQIFTLRAEDYTTLPPMRTLHHPHILSGKERTRYMDAKTLLRVEDEERIIALNDKGTFQKLQTLCSGFIYDPATSSPVWSGDSSKLEAVADMVASMVGEGEQVLLFYAFRAEAAYLRVRLEREGVTVVTPDKKDFLNQWNSRTADVLLAHPASCGHGLNLQDSGARLLVWSSLTFDLELWQQASARLHRRGQMAPVDMHVFYARGTVEEHALYALQKKSRLMDDFKNETRR
ncbi:MAG: DEAD/DEAH box helicase [Ruminococcus sp.]|nr:DEAD/DEAH box helicase [Ruminococcus sp.]